MTPSEMIKELINDDDSGIIGNWIVAIGHGFDGSTNSNDRQITIMDTGGLPSNPKYLLDYPSVQIMVRGGPQDYLTARVVMAGIKDLCLGVCSRDIGNDGDRIVSITEGTNIEYVGLDINNRHQFAYNLRLITEPNTNVQTNRLPL